VETRVTQISRTACWSVRQCTERAAALEARADVVVRDLDAFEGELGIGIAGGFDSRCEEHQAAVTLIGQLLELADHLQACLRYGFALAPTPAAATPLPPTPPVTYQQPQPQPPSYKPAAAIAGPELLDRAAAAARCRLSPDELVNVRNTMPTSGRRS
jgi:hypothetical protein